MHLDTNNSLVILLLHVIYLHHLHHTTLCITHSLSTILSNNTHLINPIISDNRTANKDTLSEIQPKLLETSPLC